MPARPQVIVVYAAGLVQGLALVTFPAASAIFTSPNHYGLSRTQYGAMFLPQALAAVLASWLGARWAQREGVRPVYLVGLFADFLSMALLYTSQFAIRDHAVSYAMLLLATTSLGVGFGLTVPALNTLASALAEGKADSALLILNALLGIGTALAPALISLFIWIGNWSTLPLMVALSLAALLTVSVRLPVRETAPPRSSNGDGKLVARFWLFGAFALLYGIIETINGNWATLYMQSSLGASATMSSLALTMFWLTVTLGRLFFAAMTRWLSPALTYRALPFVCTAAVWLTASLRKGDEHSGIVAFSLAGFGCSALLPLTISFAQAQLASMQTAVAGAMIGFYQIGYGIAAFGVGSLAESMGLGLASLFRAAAFVSLILGALAYFVVSNRVAKVPQPKPS